MKVSTRYLFNLRKDSLTLLSTAGVLGETYIDIDSSQAKGPQAQDGDMLPSREVPDFSDMVRSGQGTLQNMDALLKRLIASSPSSKAARARSANCSTIPRSTTG